MAEVDNICGKISRVIFVIINMLLGVVGVAAIALGSYVVHIARTEGGIGVVLAGGALLIVGGIIVVLVTSAGIYGAVSLSKIMLGIYIFCVVIIVILEIVGAILGFVFRKKVVTYAGDLYLKGISNYRPKNDSQFNKNNNNMIDSVQSRFKCCGWNDTIANWENSPYYKATKQFPASCKCPGSTTANCVNSTLNSQTIWNSTCQASVTNLLKKNLGIIGGVGAAIAVIQLFPLMLAIILICTISSDYKQV